MNSLFFRLGRQSATSNATLLWVYVMVNLGTLLTNTRSSGISIGVIAIPSLTSAAVFILIVMYLRGTLSKIARPGMRFIATLAVIVTAWIIRSVTFNLLLPEYAGINSFFEVIRAAMGVLYICFIMLIVSEVIDRGSSHRLLLTELNGRRQELEESLDTFSDRLAQAKASLDLAIHEVIAPSLSTLDVVFTANKISQKGTDQAQQLRDILTLNIRPTLDDLASAAPYSARPEEAMRPDAPRISRNINIPDSIRPAFMVVPIRVFTLIVFFTYTNAATAVSVFFILLISWPALSLIRRYFPLSCRESPTLNAVFTLSVIFLVTLGVPNLIMLALFHEVLLYFQPIFVVVSILFSVAIAWCIAAAQIIERNRRRLEQELQDTNEQMQISISQLHQELWFYRRNLMWIIHGPVQSALVSAALKLEETEHVDQAEMNELRDQIDTAYATLHTTGSGHPSFSGFLELLSRLWGGLCEITVNDPGNLIIQIDESASIAASASEIVRESVSNAVRHGSATLVSIFIDSSVERLVSIEIGDNGSGLDKNAVLGLGSELFDSLAFRWSRSSSVSGTVVRCDLAWGSHSVIEQPRVRSG